jgi:hypothetical protein
MDVGSSELSVAVAPEAVGIAGMLIGRVHHDLAAERPAAGQARRAGAVRDVLDGAREFYITTSPMNLVIWLFGYLII